MGKPLKFKITRCKILQVHIRYPPEKASKMIQNYAGVSALIFLVIVVVIGYFCYMREKVKKSKNKN
jgi:hypothetical protein